MSSPIQRALESVKDQTQGLGPNDVAVIELTCIRFQKFSPELKAEFQKFVELQSLVINDCDINSLQNFPRLPNLKRLDLVFNKIKGQDLIHLQRGVRNLWTLMLGGNDVQKIQHFRAFQTFPNLIHLDTLNNPVEEETGFREEIFQTLPRLVILDTQDKAGRDCHQFKTQLTAAGVPSMIFDPPKIEKRELNKDKPAGLNRTQSRELIAAANKVNINKLLDEMKKKNVISDGQKQDQKEESKEEQKAEPPRSAPPKPTPVSIKSAPVAAPVVAPQVERQPRTEINQKLEITGQTGQRVANIDGVSRTQSSRAGITFPVGRIGRHLRKASFGNRVTSTAPVYLASVLEYIAAEILEIAGNETKGDRQTRIMPSAIGRAIRRDPELHSIFKSSVLSEGGKL